MKQPEDTKTIDMLTEKRGRGRPKTGAALSDAERAKVYRERKKSTPAVASSSPSTSNEVFLLQCKIKQFESAAESNAAFIRQLQTDQAAAQKTLDAVCDENKRLRQENAALQFGHGDANKRDVTKNANMQPLGPDAPSYGMLESRIILLNSELMLKSGQHESCNESINDFRGAIQTIIAAKQAKKGVSQSMVDGLQRLLDEDYKRRGLKRQKVK